MKILHSGIGMQTPISKSLKRSADTLFEKAKEGSPDLIIIAGDVFDSRDIKLDSDACKAVFKVVYNLSEIAPVAIITGTPRHEGTATESLIFASAEHNIAVSARPEQLFLKEGQLYREFTLTDPDAIISMDSDPHPQNNSCRGQMTK